MPSLHALFFVAAATQSAIVPLLPRIGHAYGLGASATGVLLAAPGVATLAVSLPAGMIADRLGPRRVTIAATILMSIATLAQAVSSYQALVAGRLAFGFAFDILWTTGVAWMTRSEEQSGSPRVGAVATSAAVGMVAGPAISGLIADRFGLASPLLLLAAVAALLAGLLWREAAPPLSSSADAEDNSLRSFIRVAPRQPGMLSAALALAVAGAVGGVTQLLVPLQLHESGFGAGVRRLGRRELRHRRLERRAIAM